MIRHNSIDLFQLCEWGGNCDKQPISDGGLLRNGATLNAQGRGIPTVPGAGFLYSGETFTPTGLRRNGAQLVFPRPGCRPRFSGQQSAWTHTNNTNAHVTRFINRFSDGAVWISTAANQRTGTQISWPIAGTTLPRGVRYVMILLIGGGGGGGGAGGSLQHSGAGGGGGACVACCVRLPENGNATLTIGGMADGGTNYNEGREGQHSGVSCGAFWCTAQGGGAGRTASNSSNTSRGGTMMSSGNNADGHVFASGNGGTAPGKNNPGNGASFTITDYAPEGGSLIHSSNGGASGGSSGGGGGGASAYFGAGGNGGNGAPGSPGQGYGGGGGGGGVAFLQQHPGGRSAPGHVIVRY